MTRPGTSNMLKKLSEKTKPIITDTSPLLLLLIGLYDKNVIESFKRLSRYDSYDYDLLLQFITRRKIIVTPQVLSEVSNFANRLKPNKFSEFIEENKPTLEKIEVREGRKQTVKERIFPGYILVNMILDDISWHIVRSTPGVTSFVGIGNRPTSLSDKEVETILKFSELEAPIYKASFSIGEAIRIIDGPFADFIGTVDEINEEKGKLKALVSIFGRETPVELDFLQVSKL